jgi:DNA polymerase-3 subunit epsilon
VAQDFVDFIGDARLVIHNAAFDMKFLNHEWGGWAIRRCRWTGARHRADGAAEVPGLARLARRAVPALRIDNSGGRCTGRFWTASSWPRCIWS